MSRIKVTVLAPWFIGRGEVPTPWLDDFVEDRRFEFHRVYTGRRHEAGLHAGYRRWAIHFEQATRALLTPADIFVSVFKELTFSLLTLKRLKRDKRPVVSWSASIGHNVGPLARAVVRFAVEQPCTLVYHSRPELDDAAEAFPGSPANFEFVHFASPHIDVTEAEDFDDPHIIAMGDANRDFRTFFEAVERVGVRTVVIARPKALADLQIPANVETLSGLTLDDCRRRAQRAALSVVPLKPTRLGAGHITIADAMTMGRPVIATDTAGAADYVHHGVDGLLVEPGSSSSLAEAIAKLMEDGALRQRLGTAARETARRSFSDESRARELVRLIEAYF